MVLIANFNNLWGTPNLTSALSFEVLFDSAYFHLFRNIERCYGRLNGSLAKGRFRNCP